MDALRAKPSLLILLFFAITACEGGAPNPPAKLPTPIVHLTHFISPTPVASIPVSETSSAFGEATPSPSSLEKFARDLYGERLIVRILIPAIGVDSEVVPVGWRAKFAGDGKSSEIEWDSPGANVGWIVTSALPGDHNNILMYGHNNMYVEVFKRLGDLKKGNFIYLQTSVERWKYEVQKTVILPILGADEDQKANYQQYLQPTTDERLTLISCWPPVSNTHRVVVIARFVPSQ